MTGLKSFNIRVVWAALLFLNTALAHGPGGNDVYLVSMIAKPLCVGIDPARAAEVSGDYAYFGTMYADWLTELRAEDRDGKSFVQLEAEFEARVSKLPLKELRAECKKIMSVVDSFNQAVTLASTDVAARCGKHFPGFDDVLDNWKDAHRDSIKESEADEFFSYLRDDRAGWLRHMNDGKLQGRCERIFSYMRQPR